MTSPMQVLDGQDSEAVHQDSSKENNFLGAHLFGIREVVLKNLTPVPDCWYPQAPPFNRLLRPPTTTMARTWKRLRPIQRKTWTTL